MEMFAYILLGILILSLLVFVHELGHYIVAIATKMKVLTFSIGFGRPLLQWKLNSVAWQIGWIPFGGYVKIAGMDGEEGDPLSPAERAAGLKTFVEASPLSRIYVAVAGPAANLILSFCLLSGIYFSGGQSREFQKVTQIAGWVEPTSPLYAAGLRPGDRILSYEGRTCFNENSHVEAAMLKEGAIEVMSEKLNPLNGTLTRQEYRAQAISHPYVLDREIKTTGVLKSANYLYYTQNNPAATPLFSPEELPMGSRILWCDGELLFSSEQLQQVLNRSSSFVTILREGHLLQLQLPVYFARDLPLIPHLRNEWDDIRHDAGIPSLDVTLLLPYQIDSNLTILSEIPITDRSSKFVLPGVSSLLPKDKILAIAGKMVQNRVDLLKHLQLQERLLIIQLPQEATGKPITVSSSFEADHDFYNSIPYQELAQIASTIGTSSQIAQKNNLHLLSSVIPKNLRQLYHDPATIAAEEENYQNQVEKLNLIKDVALRERTKQQLKMLFERKMLGIILNDQVMNYNPPPLATIEGIFHQTVATVNALIHGYLSPKWLSGPIGIVKLISHQSSSGGIITLVYWAALISIHLALLNLLPFPIFDGGHILFSSLEMILRRPIRGRWVDLLMLVCVYFLIGLTVFITYYDLFR